MSFSCFMYGSRPRRKKDEDPKREIRYIIRISKNKFICAKSEEIVGYKMRLGSLVDNCKIIKI
jgi:hypothetical protein